ncbi:MAG TPA: asparaginase [Gaiellaceae bacterium]|nr:asparaginase [Gaiellaceae bacterium]
MEPISVAARRGEVVESAHRVHAVAVRDGEVIDAAGDPDFVTFMRSAAKPLQAVPLAYARDDLELRHLAIASASHLADEAQLDAVRSLLELAEATEDDLECGPYQGSRLNHNCSGKHAGMLALCRAHGWPTQGYRLAGHPCQEAMLSVVAEAAGVAAGKVPTAVDGCGVVTFALPLHAMGRAFAALERLPGGAEVGEAMRAYPELIRGPGADDTTLMQSHPGWTAKGGAEGLLCAVGPESLTLVLKVEDGNGRALRPALGVFLERLGLPSHAFGPAPIRNSRDDVVGRLEAR